MKTITVTIDSSGRATVATKGFAGAECLKATAELEKALGATASDTKTPEYRQTAPLAQKAGQ